MCLAGIVRAARRRRIPAPPSQGRIASPLRGRLTLTGSMPRWIAMLLTSSSVAGSSSYSCAQFGSLRQAPAPPEHPSNAHAAAVARDLFIVIELPGVLKAA